MSSIKDSYASLLSFMSSETPQSSRCVSSRQTGQRAAQPPALGLQEVVAQLDGDLNEVYLWHGTRVRTGLQIAQDDHAILHQISH